MPCCLHVSNDRNFFILSAKKKKNQMIDKIAASFVKNWMHIHKENHMTKFINRMLDAVSNILMCT